jgi:hypothetical protein
MEENKTNNTETNTTNEPLFEAIKKFTDVLSSFTEQVSEFVKGIHEKMENGTITPEQQKSLTDALLAASSLAPLGLGYPAAILNMYRKSTSVFAAFSQHTTTPQAGGAYKTNRRLHKSIAEFHDPSLVKRYSGRTRRRRIV